MKTTFNKLLFIGVLFALTLVTFSCTDNEKPEEDPINPPIANFTFDVSDENSLMVNFTNDSEKGETYSWDFGDGSTSTEKDPSHTYTEADTYSVTLTVTNEDGFDKLILEVTVNEPIEAAPLILNGGFDNVSEWTIISHNASSNGKLTIANGVAIWDELVDVQPGDWDNVAHMGMYQKIEVDKAGNYQLDLDITINGFQETWFEVYVGTTVPVAGADYGTPAVKVLVANAWDCNGSQGTYSGSLAANSCNNTNGQISLTAGTYYVVIRSGGFNFGNGGIVVDNVSMTKVN